MSDTCPTCEGLGYYEIVDRDQDGWYTFRKWCPTCKPEKAAAAKLAKFEWTLLSDPDPSERIFQSREDI
jgi:hypothetical protein